MLVEELFSSACADQRERRKHHLESLLIFQEQYPRKSFLVIWLLFMTKTECLTRKQCFPIETFPDSANMCLLSAFFPFSVFPEWPTQSFSFFYPNCELVNNSVCSAFNQREIFYFLLVSEHAGSIFFFNSLIFRSTESQWDDRKVVINHTDYLW